MDIYRPLVSVIIPAYNAEKYITNTLESVINQTWGNIEIIVIDDGSVDKTREIVTKAARIHTNIQYYQQENKGCPIAKNIGLSYARGEFIQYLDSDDLLSQDKIESQINALKNKPYALAVCKTIVFQESAKFDTGHEIDTSHLYSTKNPFAFFLNLYGFNNKEGMIQPNAFLMHKKLADKVGIWDSRLSQAPNEDSEYFCRVILNCNEIIYTGGVNYYRKLENNNSLSKKNSFQYALGAMQTEKLKSSHLLQIDSSYPCLLYTSPSPRDRQKSRMPSSA